MVGLDRPSRYNYLPGPMPSALGFPAWVSARRLHNILTELSCCQDRIKRRVRQAGGTGLAGIELSIDLRAESGDFPGYH